MTFGSPALLNKSGGCGTRFAQTVLADNSWFVCVARHGIRGLQFKTMPSFTVVYLNLRRHYERSEESRSLKCYLKAGFFATLRMTNNWCPATLMYIGLQGIKKYKFYWLVSVWVQVFKPLSETFQHVVLLFAWLGKSHIALEFLTKSQPSCPKHRLVINPSRR